MPKLKDESLEGRSYDRWQRMVKRTRMDDSKIDPRWLTYANFLADVGLPPAADYRLVRIKRRQGWFPGNTEWIKTEKRGHYSLENQERKEAEAALRFNWAGLPMAYVKGRDKVPAGT